MGLLDKLKSTLNPSEDVENNGEIASDILKDKASTILKQLSGGDAKYVRKLVDNVVTFTGASGGVGVSTIVSNVASLAADSGLNVMIIDLNIMYPIQHTFFGIEQKIERPDLVSYLLGKNSLGESVMSNGSISLLIPNNRGLMDSINCEMQSAVNNFASTLDQLRKMFDLIIIDAPMLVEHLLINTVFYLSNQIYLVWDESISSISNTERIRRNMLASGIDAYSKMKVILNKKTSVNYSKYPIEKLNLELVDVLPFDVAIIECGLRSKIFCQKGSTSSKNAGEFYHKMVSITNTVLRNGGFTK